MKWLLKFTPIFLAAAVFLLVMPAQKETQPLAVTINIIGPTIFVPDPMLLLPKKGSAANMGAKTIDETGKRVSCGSLTEAKGALIGVLVPCIANTIQKSAMKFSQKMIDFLRPALYSFLTLVISIYGVKLLQGERQVHVEGFMLLVKIALVFTTMEAIPGYIVPQTYNIMNQGVATAASALGGEGGIHCDVEKYGDENTALVWKQSDCILGKLYGFSTGKNIVTGEKTTNMLLSASAFGLLTGFFFGGTIGVTVFFALIGVLVSVLLLVMRVAVSYINGYLTVCVMLLLAPIFMPLALMKVTTEYFDKWWKAVLGGMLMPIVVTSYTVMALLVYDALLFSPDSKLQRLFDYNAVKTATEQSRAPCTATVSGNTQFLVEEYNKKAGGTAADVDPNANPVANTNTLNEMVKNKFTNSIMNPLLSLSNDGCGVFKATQFDITKVEASLITDAKNNDFADGKKVMEHIFMEAIKLFLMTYLIGLGLKEVEVTYAGFAAGSNIGAGLMRSGQITGAIEGALGRAQATMKDALRGDAKRNEKGEVMYDRDGNAVREYGEAGPKGADFIKQMPGAVSKSATATISGFLGGINRK